jgi:hypothetical protein
MASTRCERAETSAGGTERRYRPANRCLKRFPDISSGLYPKGRERAGLDPSPKVAAHDDGVESPCPGCIDRLDVDLKITLRDGGCLSMRKCRVCHLLVWEYEGRPIERETVMAVMAENRSVRPG